MSVTTSCHCGACVLELARAPVEVTDCNCSICRRYGVLWAYYIPDEVDRGGLGPTDIYMWDDRALEFHRCRGCGCVTHWQAVDATVQRMGVNARLTAPEVLEAASIRHYDGASAARGED